MEKRVELITVMILILLCMCSCRTVETKTEYVYIKETMDIQDSVDILFDTRPKDYVPAIPDETYLFRTTNDYELALVATEGLLEEWEDYSYALEIFISGLAETLKGNTT